MAKGKWQYKQKNTKSDILYAVQKEAERRGITYTYSINVDDVRKISRRIPKIEPDGQLSEKYQHRIWWNRTHSRLIVERLIEEIIKEHSRKEEFMTKWAEITKEQMPLFALSEALEEPIFEVQSGTELHEVKAEEPTFKEFTDLALAAHELARVFCEFATQLAKFERLNR